MKTDGIEYSDEDLERMRVEVMLDERLKHIPMGGMRLCIEYTPEELAEAQKKASELVRELGKSSMGWAKVYGGDK